MHFSVLLFPKTDKHSIGEVLQTKSLQLIETILLASRVTGLARKERLLQANAELDLLKLLIRLTHEIKAVDDKKYILLEGYLQKTGKMLGGWLRSLP